MTAEAWLQSKLTASTAVTDLLSSWKARAPVVTYYMIFNGWIIPELSALSYKIKKDDSDTTALLTGGKFLPTVQFRTVKFYRETQIDGYLPHKEASYSINCRAYTQADAEALALAVYNALNKTGDSQHNCLCLIEQVIPPRDEQDNFNARITAKMKTTGA